MASRTGRNQLLIVATVGKHTSRMASWQGEAPIPQSKKLEAGIILFDWNDELVLKTQKQNFKLFGWKTPAWRSLSPRLRHERGRSTTPGGSRFRPAFDGCEILFPDARRNHRPVERSARLRRLPSWLGGSGHGPVD
jgi:hypothetical protein